MTVFGDYIATTRYRTTPDEQTMADFPGLSVEAVAGLTVRGLKRLHGHPSAGIAAGRRFSSIMRSGRYVCNRSSSLEGSHKCMVHLLCHSHETNKQCPRMLTCHPDETTTPYHNHSPISDLSNSEENRTLMRQHSLNATTCLCHYNLDSKGSQPDHAGRSGFSQGKYHARGSPN